MIVYPKEEIKNMFGQVLWFKDKPYECMPYYNEDDWFVVCCELIANEYPEMNSEEIKKKFYTIEERRDKQINKITE